jgi:hypothetical protein
MALSATVDLSSPELGAPADWRLRVAVRNDDDIPARLTTATLLGPVAFEVVDADGAPVALGPPPMPPDDLAADLVTLEPNGTLTLEFHGDELLADPPPPGRYRLRFAGRTPEVGDAPATEIVSPWVPFAVA